MIAISDTILKILAIDKDDNTYRREAPEWKKKGINAIQAKSMQEAITRLNNGERFIAVYINADNIAYLPQLHIIHNIVPNMPLLPITSNYSSKECILSCQAGARYLYRWHELPKDNVETILSMISTEKYEFYNNYNYIPIYYYHNLLIIPGAYRFVFMDDHKIPLSRYEYEVLLMLVRNKGKIVEHSEFITTIWGVEYDDVCGEYLRKTIARLKKKIKSDFIENVRGIGYRLKII